MKKSSLASILVVVVVLPLTLILGTKLPGRWYYLTATLVVIESMLPFFFYFEGRRPQARELVILAVMAAIAAVSRVAFSFIPHFKPITAIVMITGIAFGAQAGFLTGAISAFASNFFFSQGAWTPWQMMAYGVGGFLAGMLFHRESEYRKPFYITVFGFLSVVLIIGPILDCCTIFTILTKITAQSTLLVFAQGIPANLFHAISCAVTLALVCKPLMQKLDRLKNKYGILK